MDIERFTYAHAMDILTVAAQEGLQPSFWLVPPKMWSALVANGRTQQINYPTGQLLLLLGYPMIRTHVVEDLWLECEDA